MGKADGEEQDGGKMEFQKSQIPKRRQKSWQVMAGRR